jgi:hypothetical protein
MSWSKGFSVFAAVMAAPLLGFGTDEPRTKPDLSISEIMLRAHQPKRQFYRALDQVVISGRATEEEKKQLVGLYEALKRAKPPGGSIESWKRDMDRIVEAARAVASGDDAATGRLLAAINCTVCHEKYRTASAAEGTGGPMSPAESAFLARMGRGGTNWSTPSKARISQTEYLQPGRRALIWPAEDRVFPIIVSPTHKSASISFRWWVLPGANLPDQGSGAQYYIYAPVAAPTAGSYEFARGIRSDARSGTADLLLTFGQTDLRGEQEVVIVLMLNSTVAVPISNFLKFKVKFPD